MIRIPILRRLAAAVAVCGALFPFPAPAAQSCHLINAKAVGQDTGNLTTLARTIGGGLLHGTLAGRLQLGDLAGNTRMFTETIQFTTHDGTLTVDLEGGIDVAGDTPGQFKAMGSVTAATGKLAGATGHLAFSGIVNFQNQTFTEEISGVVCVDLAP